MNGLSPARSAVVMARPVPLPDDTEVPQEKPELAAAQEQLPLPSVVSTLVLEPALVGSFIVQVPAASATESVTVPLVVPFNAREPVVEAATPAVSVVKVAVVGVIAPTVPFTLPVSGQENQVAAKIAVFELKVRPAFVFGHRSPVVAVKKAGKQVVSVASFATVIMVGVPPHTAENVGVDVAH